MLGDVTFEGRDGFTHTGEGPAASPLSAAVAEEALELIEPGGPGRCGVRMKARVTLKPADHSRVLERAVIIGDHEQFLVRWGLLIRKVEKFQRFLVGVAGHASARHFVLQDAERRKQGRCLVALVIVRHRLEAAGLERQPRLRAVENLNLAFSSTERTTACAGGFR